MAATNADVERLVKAARGLSPEVLRELVALVQSLAGGRRRVRPRRSPGLAQFAGILRLDEDPVEWQRRIRAEWDDR
jgi:hypothetical protein